MYRWWIVVACLLPLADISAESIECEQCEAWNQDQAPFRIFGNTYYVGTRGLSSVLIVAPSGHVLIDGALPQSAPLIARHIEQLGFRMSDVKLILNSHVHFDHAGGIAELQKLSGAKVIVSDAAAAALRSGEPDRADPQFRTLIPYPGADNVQTLGSRNSVSIGKLELKAIRTPGHTRGGTSWTWQSCEAERCLTMVYGDSLSAVSDDTFRYSGDERYPEAKADLLGSMKALDAVACDILVTAHPGLAQLWLVFDEQGRGDRERLVDAAACKHYAATARDRFARRLESERKE